MERDEFFPNVPQASHDIVCLIFKNLEVKVNWKDFFVKASRTS